MRGTKQVGATMRSVGGAPKPLRIALVDGVDPQLRLVAEQAAESQLGKWELVVYDSLVNVQREPLSPPPDLLLVDDEAADPRAENLRGMLDQTPGLILAAHAHVDRVISWLTAGARGYLVKPVTPNELMAAIAEIAHDESVVSPAAVSALIQWFRDPFGGQRFASLTLREREILLLIIEGCRVKDVSARLGIAENTVRAHRAALYSKLRVHGRKELIAQYAERPDQGL